MAQPATIRVQANDPIGVVHPFLFGQFVEHFPGQVYGGIFDPASRFSDGDGFRSDVIAALRDISVPVIRWPGGCFASRYRWRWGIGPRSDRAVQKSTVWRVPDSHQFGTGEFIELCRKTGAEPYICVGVGRGEHFTTPEEAAQWVRYCNASSGPEAELRAEHGHAEAFNVKLWGLGNEVFAGIYDDPKAYAADVVSFAAAMRRADPELRFVIVGAEREWLWDWNETLLENEAAVRAADWISWHDYLHTGMCESREDGSGVRQPYHKVMEWLVAMDATFGRHRKLNGEASARAGTPRPLELAVDEWNELGWELFDNVARNDDPESYTLSNAIYTAGFLNAMIRNSDLVTMANYSPAVNTRGLMHAGPEGLLLRPTYYVYRMYRCCAGGTGVAVRVESDGLEDSTAPVVDAAAVLKDPTGRGHTELMLLLANRHPLADVACVINVEGVTRRTGSAELLTAESLESYNTLESPDAVAPRAFRVNGAGDPFEVDLPARSIVALTLECHA